MINKRANARGMTLISFIIVLAVGGFMLFIVSRLYPTYKEYVRASRVILDTVKPMDPKTTDQYKIREALEDALARKQIVNIKVNRNIRIVRTPEGYKKVRLYYEVRQPLIYNLHYIAKFDRYYPIGNPPPPTPKK